MLIVQYFAQMNLGISHSVNAIISVKKDELGYIAKVFNTSIVMVGLLSVLVVASFVLSNLFGINLGAKYNFFRYEIFVCLLIVVNYFIVLFTNLFRAYGKLSEIAFSQSVFPFLMLLSSIFFKGDELLWALIYSNLFGCMLSFFLFIIRSPIEINPKFDFDLAKVIQRRGIYLFLYNTSFYLILISTRMIVSSYYTVSEFGILTFSFSLATVITLFLDSISFLIFPKMLNKIATSNDLSFLTNIREMYMMLSQGLVYFAICLFPVFLIFFPKYQSSLDCFRIITLSTLIYANSFGYQGLLIAKGKEKILGFLSLLILLINILLGISLAKNKVPLQDVFFSTLISYFLYILVLVYCGRLVIGRNTSLKSILTDAFPIKFIIPYLTATLLVCLNTSNLLYLAPLFMFLCFNIKEFKQVVLMARNIINKPEIIDF